MKDARMMRKATESTRTSDRRNPRQTDGSPKRENARINNTKDNERALDRQNPRPTDGTLDRQDTKVKSRR